MSEVIKAFLSEHDFPVSVDTEAVTDMLRCDMHLGIYGGALAAGQNMVRTWMLPPEELPRDKSVIVIDAGGTNFRSCLVRFTDGAAPEISSMEKCAMPAVDRELSRTEFFDTIAKNLEHLKDKADVIGFCFSYGMKITKDGDGIVIGFSKEVKAPEVVGTPVGAGLKAALTARGWNRNIRIVLLNDTVAALLAGAAVADKGRKYSSYMGFILGTGINTAYIQNKIPQIKDFDRQIVVCEAGKFDKIAKSDFDRALDEKSSNRGTYIFEKMCSGAYLGPLSLIVLKNAAQAGLFSRNAAAKIAALDKLALIDVDEFLYAPHDAGGMLAGIAAGHDEQADRSDVDTMYELLDAVILRASHYAAAMIAAGALECGGGTKAAEPVCILCNGTTFYKTHRLGDRIRGELDEILTQKHGISYELVSRENDITLGTAIAALSKIV